MDGCVIFSSSGRAPPWREKTFPSSNGPCHQPWSGCNCMSSPGEVKCHTGGFETVSYDKMAWLTKVTLTVNNQTPPYWLVYPVRKQVRGTRFYLKREIRSITVTSITLILYPLHSCICPSQTCHMIRITRIRYGFLCFLK